MSEEIKCPKCAGNRREFYELLYKQRGSYICSVCKVPQRVDVQEDMNTAYRHAKQSAVDGDTVHENSVMVKMKPLEIVLSAIAVVVIVAVIIEVIRNEAEERALYDATHLEEVKK